MPDQTILQRLEDLTRQQNGKPDKLLFYLEETKRCIKGKAWSAAVVMAWCACIEHLYTIANKVPKSFVFYSWFKVQRSERIPDHFSSTKIDDLRDKDKEKDKGLREKDFMTLMETMKMIPDRLYSGSNSKLHAFIQRRHEIAHPIEPSTKQERAEDFISSLISLLECMPSLPLIYDESMLCDYLADDLEAKIARGGPQWSKKTKQEIEKWLQKTPAEIAEYIHPSKRLDAMKKLLEKYIATPECDHDLFAAAFEKLWSFMDSEQQYNLWREIAKKAIQVLKRVSGIRNPHEFARLIVWPDPTQANLYRDWIMKQYVIWLVKKIKDKNFDTDDLELVIWFFDKLPNPHRLALLKSLQRWFVNKVNNENFVGEDFDLLNFFRSRGTRPNSKCWKIIFDHMSRRYV